MIGVVGAGISGLSLVHHLDRRGIDAVAFDAAPEPGGVIRSGRVDGVVVEWGPQRIRKTEPVADLIDDLDLGAAVVEADPDLPLLVYADGHLRRVPRSLAGFLRTDLLSWRGKLRVLCEPLTGAASNDERAADLFERKFGREAYRRLLGPLFGGLYGSDPTEMRVGDALSSLVDIERRDGSLLRAALGRVRSGGIGGGTPPVSFAEGLQQLPGALHGAHSDRVHMETPVEAIRSTSDGYRLETAAGAHAVDRVVVTAPAGAAADVLGPVAPDAAGRLERLHYNRLALVSLRADRTPVGFGYQVARGESLHTRGVTFNGSLFDRDGLCTCFLGGMEDPEIVDEPDDHLGRVASEEFRRVVGVDTEAIDVERVRIPAYDTSWAALDGLELPAGIDLVTNYAGRIGVPSRIREARRVSEQIAGE